VKGGQNKESGGRGADNQIATKSWVIQFRYDYARVVNGTHNKESGGGGPDIEVSTQ